MEHELISADGFQGPGWRTRPGSVTWTNGLKRSGSAEGPGARSRKLSYGNIIIKCFVGIEAPSLFSPEMKLYQKEALQREAGLPPGQIRGPSPDTQQSLARLHLDFHPSITLACMSLDCWWETGKPTQGNVNAT